jgi:uncharacterized RDD family membrane protein YckC
MANLHSAPLMRRIGALLIDGLVLAVPVMVLTLVLVPLLGESSPLIALAKLALMVAYYVWLLGSPRSATFGMRALKLRMVDAQGQPLSRARAGRWIAMNLVLTLLCLAPYLYLTLQIFQVMPQTEILAAQESGGHAADVLVEAAHRMGMQPADLQQQMMLLSLSTLLLFLFWFLTVLVMRDKRGLHNLLAKTVIVRI